MENNQLTTTQDKNQFIQDLNLITGFNTNISVLPMIKFNGETGLWEEQTDEKNEENKPIYKEIGETIIFQLITTRKMMQNKFSSKTRYYSREFQNTFLTIFNGETKEEVFKGFYSDLKNEPLYNDLQYVQVLYVYYNGNPYRIKLSGAKLNNFFPYLNSFEMSSPAMFMTIASRGELVKQSAAVKYYVLDFIKGVEVEQGLIIQRVNKINNYLKDYNKKVQTNIPIEPKTTQIDYAELKNEVEDEIAIENIPF